MGKVIGIIGASFLLSEDDIFNSVRKVFLHSKNIIKKEIANHYLLSKRQLECFFFLIRGKSDKEIAKILQLSPRTVESYIDEIKSKMSCSTRAEIIEKAFDEGMLNWSTGLSSCRSVKKSYSI